MFKEPERLRTFVASQHCFHFETSREIARNCCKPAELFVRALFRRFGWLNNLPKQIKPGHSMLERMSLGLVKPWIMNADSEGVSPWEHIDWPPSHRHLHPNNCQSQSSLFTFRTVCNGRTGIQFFHNDIIHTKLVVVSDGSIAARVEVHTRCFRRTFRVVSLVAHLAKSNAVLTRLVNTGLPDCCQLILVWNIMAFCCVQNQSWHGDWRVNCTRNLEFVLHLSGVGQAVKASIDRAPCPESAWGSRIGWTNQCCGRQTTFEKHSHSKFLLNEIRDLVSHGQAWSGSWTSPTGFPPSCLNFVRLNPDKFWKHSG